MFGRRGTGALLALVSLFAGGCGGASRPLAVTTVKASGSETTAAASTASSAPSTPTVAPELIVCQEEPGSRTVQLEGFSGGSEGVSVSLVASFSNIAEKTCTLSSDLSKLAEVSDTSDGSKLAGYLPAGGGGFVNLSGHDSNSYSDTPVEDQDPVFNPASGELWWMRGDDLWSAPATGGTAHDHGPSQLGGNLVAFTAAGEPTAYPVLTSPDGRLGAVAGGDDTGGETRLYLTVGTASAFTTSCLKGDVRGCPGVASVSLPEPNCASSVGCRTLLGFVSDSALVCQVNDAGSERFDVLSFKRAGRQLKIVGDVPLTPPTQMSIGAVRVAPDGKTLWYVATRHGSATESSEATNLYVIPTNTPTAEPAPVSLTPAISLPTITMAGWRWHGHFSPSD